MGLATSSQVFTREMRRFLGDCEWVLIYIDDILISSRTFEEHLQHVAEVMRRLSSNGLVLSLNKCAFACSTIEFLGKTINRFGTVPAGANVESIMKLPKPRNSTELRRFVGASGFFRSFIRNYAHIAAPLTDLLQGVKGKRQRIG